MSRASGVPCVGLSLALALSSCGAAPTVQPQPRTLQQPWAPFSDKARVPSSVTPEPPRPEATEPAASAAPEHRQSEAPEPTASAALAASPSSSPPPARPEFVDLPVAGFEPAVLSVPDSESPKRPVLVVAHGAGGEARWHCEMWRHLTKNRGYVLCPRGVPIDRRTKRGYYFPDHHHLEREVLACVQALWAHASDADRSGLVYVGYSQGATMGALMVENHGDIFSRLVLIEGGSYEWNIPHANRFRQLGGERVLFVCGRAHCDAGARQSAKWLRDAGLQARTEYARGAGHTPFGRVAERIAQSLPWLLDGDNRW